MARARDPLEKAPGRLWENVISLYLLQGLNYVIPMAILPFLVRVLGMERYGLTAVAQSFAMYFTLLTDYGFNFSATRAIAQKRDDPDLVSRIFCSVLLIKLAILCLSSAILAGALIFIPAFHQNAKFFLAAFLAVLGNVLFPLWLFQGMEEMRYISAVFGGSRLLAALALFLLVRSPSDALLSLMIQSSALVLGGAAGLWIGIRRFRLNIVRPNVSDMRSAVHGGWHLFVSTTAITLYTNTNVFLVGILAGNVQAGYFSAAEKLVRATQGLITPVTQAVFPHMNQLAAQSKAMALDFAGRMLRWLGGATFIASLAILMFAYPLVSIYLGKGAIGSIAVIRWIAFIPFLVAVSNILAVQTMIPFGLDRQLSRILVLAGLLNLSMAIPLIRTFAAEGAGISVLFTEMFVTAFAALALRHKQIRVSLWQTAQL